MSKPFAESFQVAFECRSLPVKLWWDLRHNQGQADLQRGTLLKLFQPSRFCTSSRLLALTARSSLAPPYLREYDVICICCQRSCFHTFSIFCRLRVRTRKKELSSSSCVKEKLQAKKHELMSCQVQRNAGVVLVCFSRLSDAPMSSDHLSAAPEIPFIGDKSWKPAVPVFLVVACTFRRASKREDQKAFVDVCKTARHHKHPRRWWTGDPGLRFPIVR